MCVFPNLILGLNIKVGLIFNVYFAISCQALVYIEQNSETNFKISRLGYNICMILQ